MAIPMNVFMILYMSPRKTSFRAFRGLWRV